MPKKNKIWFYKTKFANKIALMYGSVFTVLVLIISTAIMVYLGRTYFKFCKDELNQITEIVKEKIEVHGYLTEEELEDLQNNNRNVKITIQQFIPEPGKENDDLKEHRGINALPPGFERPDGFRGKYMSHFVVARYGDLSYGIIVERNPEQEMKMIRSFFILFLVINTVGITGAFFAGKYMSKKILGPIIVITNTAESISANDLSRRIEYEGPEDEIKVLADTFNEMIGRLEIAFNKQTRFISDASHELRTPISVIQGYANLIDRWGKDDPDILQESIDSIKSETEHMSVLIKKLLFLARSDIKDHVNKKIISLNDVAGEVAKEMSVLDVNCNIEMSQQEDITILADYDLIKQMIWVFIDNSVKYSNPKNGKISLNLYKDVNACISIKDNGAGIAEEDLPFIFERFYRADKSRNKEIPGEGIGLSIASWIVKEHNGKVAVTSKLNEGTEIIVRLPLA